MATIRTSLISSLVAVFTTGFALAFAQDGGNDRTQAGRPRTNPPRNQAAQEPDPAAARRMDVLLQQWEGQSAKLKSLEVDIYRIDKNPAWWDDEEHFVGHAAFKNPQLAYLDFRKVKLQEQADPKDKTKKKLVPIKNNNQVVSTPYQLIVCTGSEVWDHHFDVKQIFIYTLDKNARKRAIEEGPLPFLFNMKADDARQRYEMVLYREDKERYLVRIRPRFPEEKERYSIAWISLDREYLLPRRIVLIAPDGKSSQDFVLSHPQANTAVDPRFFQVVNPGKPWRVERDPGPQGPAGQANKQAPRRQPAGQAAQRPLLPNDNQPR